MKNAIPNHRKPLKKTRRTRTKISLRDLKDSLRIPATKLDTPSQESLTKVIELNQRAIPLLHNHQTHLATESLQQALDLISKVAPLSPRTTRASMRRKSPAAPARHATSIRWLRTQAGPSLRSSEYLVSPEAAFVFLNHMLSVPSLPLHLECTEGFQQTLEGIILYNLAYCYHRQALEGACERGPMIKAIHYYTRALQAINRADDKSEDEHHLCFLAVSNVGHAHSSLFHYREVAACQKILWSGIRAFRHLWPSGNLFCLVHQRLTSAPMA